MKTSAETVIHRWASPTRATTILLIGLIFLIFLPISSGSAASGERSLSPPKETHLRQWFDQANGLFDQAGQLAGTDPDRARALFRQAALGYERLVSQGGVENGRLYYNIGNAWFQAEDLGRAILNYRKALQYIPNDPNLRQNLAYARNKRMDNIAEPQKAKVLQTLFFWHYDLSTPMKMRVFGILFGTFWVVAGIRLLLKRPAFGWPLLVALGLAVMMGGSLIAEAAILRQVRPGVILAPSVVARKGNSENYAPSFNEPLHAGTEFELVEQRGPWYYIRVPDGRTCWVPADSTGMIR